MKYLPPPHIHHTVYEPAKLAIKAAVLLLHGMQEHSGRYKDFANYLKDEGYAVVTYDHTGHGRTAKTKEQFGFFRKEKPDKLLISEAKQMTLFLQDRFPDIPLILMGHSMGSFIARLLLSESSNIYRGAILMGTGASNTMATLFLPLLHTANLLRPTTRSQRLNKTFSAINNRQFKQEKPNDGTNWLSTSLANRELFAEDELCGVPFSNNAFLALLLLNVKATKANWAHNIPKEFHMLFVSGAHDPIGDFGKGVSKTVQALCHDGFQHVEMKLYPGMRHEILNENNREVVFQDVIAWLEKFR